MKEMERMLQQIKTSEVCAHLRKEEWVVGFLYSNLSRSCHTFSLACVTIRTNILKCLAVRAVANTLQPQISVINDYVQVKNWLKKIGPKTISGHLTNS